jgi:hypothetical protein
VVFNRSLPADWVGAEIPPRTSSVLADNLRRWEAEAHRQRDARAGFAARFRVPLVTIPWLAEDPTDRHTLEAVIDEASTWPALW